MAVKKRQISSQPWCLQDVDVFAGKGFVHTADSTELAVFKDPRDIVQTVVAQGNTFGNAGCPTGMDDYRRKTLFIYCLMIVDALSQHFIKRYCFPT